MRRSVTEEQKLRYKQKEREWKKRNPEKLREYSARQHERAKRQLAELKDRPCEDCGKRYPPVVMDFHHVGDDKVMGVARMVRHSRQKILAEIEKCVLLCSNCHRMRHA